MIKNHSCKRILVHKLLIIVNCKAYAQGSGSGALRIAEMAERYAKEHGVTIGIAPQALDLTAISAVTSIPVFAQHVDPYSAGRGTGMITAQALKKAGATGAILNHSEHRMRTEDITQAVKMLHKEKLLAIVCVESVARLQELLHHVRPDYFCLEPPELIAGDVSVSVARPDTVLQAVHATKIPLLIGAGVRTYEDLNIAQEMGCAGIILSSGIVLAPHKDRAFARLLTAPGR